MRCTTKLSKSTPSLMYKATAAPIPRLSASGERLRCEERHKQGRFVFHILARQKMAGSHTRFLHIDIAACRVSSCDAIRMRTLKEYKLFLQLCPHHTSVQLELKLAASNFAITATAAAAISAAATGCRWYRRCCCWLC